MGRNAPFVQEVLRIQETCVACGTEEQLRTLRAA